MGHSAITALKGLHGQLAALLPGKTSAQLWAMEGATLMIGRDDYPTPIETTSVQDAKQVRAFARTKGMAALSIWAIQRDNGNCPGSAGSDDCSGIVQPKWAFTRVLRSSPRREREPRGARDAGRPLAVGRPPGQDAADGDPAMRGRPRACQRHHGQAVDEGPMPATASTHLSLNVNESSRSSGRSRLAWALRSRQPAM